MPEKTDPRKVVTFEDLLWSVMCEQEALRRILVRKGIISNREMRAEIQAVRRQVEAQRGKQADP